MTQETTQAAGSSHGQRGKAAAVVIILIIIAAIAIAYTSQPGHAGPTTSTTTVLPNSYSLLSLASPQNALYSLPSSPPLYEYFNSTSNLSQPNGTVSVQYGANFTKSAIASPKVLPPNYTISVPPQYANLTSPFVVVISLNRYSTGTLAKAAHIGYYYHVSQLAASGFDNLTVSNVSGIGTAATLTTSYAYGMKSYTLSFFYGNYGIFVSTFGNTKYSSPTYAYGIATHMYGLVRNFTS
jgi:hypothetical protein